MNPSFSVPRSAEVAGIADRYRYWVGRSGRRYLFTRVDRRTVADFEDSVALAANAADIVAVGRACDILAAPGIDIRPGISLFVHLLASSEFERRRISADLLPEARVFALAA